MSYIFDEMETELQRALDASNMKSASFGFPTDRISIVSSHFGHIGAAGSEMHPDKFIRDNTQHYLSSWVSGPINRALSLVRTNKELLNKCESLSNTLERANLAEILHISKGGRL